MTHHAHDRTAAAALPAAVCLVLLAAGCTPSSAKPSTSAGPAGRTAAAPLVTEAEANKIADSYQSLNNDANADRSATKMAKAEGGALLANDKGYLTQAKGLDQKQVKAVLAPFAYINRTFYIPPASAKTDWFVMKAQGANLENGKPGTPWKQTTRFLVFKKTTAGWRLVLTGEFSGDDVAKVPRIAVDQDGLAQVADPHTKIGDTAPADLAGLVTDLYVSGGHYTPLIETKARTTARVVNANLEKDLDAHAFADFTRVAPRDGTIYALRTADGGVLALGDSAVNETVLAKTIYSYVNLGKELQPFVKNGDRRMSKVVIHDMLMTTAVIAAGGEPAVYGITFQATSIDATPTRKY